MEPRLEPRAITLRNGREVIVREIQPSDEEELLQAFDRFSPAARYMRFMAPRREVDVARLRNLLATLPARGLVIAATVPAADGIDIVGTASFMLDAEPGRCEFAISVVDDWAGAGLGRVLLTTLVEAARRRGLAEMHGYVLAENRAMLRLAERVGFSVRAEPGDFSVRVCTLRLGDGKGEHLSG